MEDVASVLAGDTHVADEAGCDADADAGPVLVPPLAERDQATADEVQAVEERDDLRSGPEPDLHRAALVVPSAELGGGGWLDVAGTVPRSPGSCRAGEIGRAHV